MAVVLDTLVGAVVGELMAAVLEMKDRAIKFRPTLERLESTLKSIEPVTKETEKFNRILDRPKEETEKLIEQMKSGKDLVLKCSKIQWWECCYKAHYQEELEELDQSIERFFRLDMQAQIRRDGVETLVEVKQIRMEITNMNAVPRNERIELKGLCSPPQPPEFTVGLDVAMKELKLKLLQDQVGVSVLNLTGPGGSGKTTLAKMLCWDGEVKGKFKDNIFFVTFAKTPKLNTIVQKLFQHTGYRLPELQSDEDAVSQLEHLLRQFGESPILLVLDDVWPGSESLVDNFVFEVPGYKILVTSRSSIRRFGTPKVLDPLRIEDATKLFRHSAFLNQSSSDVPDDVLKKIVKGCRGSPLALTVSGKSLCQQHLAVWENWVKELSRGHFPDSISDVLHCLEKSFDVSDARIIECFRDLGLFPDDQRIPASALVDMWAELHDDDDVSAMGKIFQLFNLNMADVVVTRKVESGTVDYSNHYVTPHALLREAAIRQASQEPEAQRNRLIIDLSDESHRKFWTKQNEYPIKARILSISTDDAFTSDWFNLQPTEVEVLVLNLHAKKCTLPMFMTKMSKLKVLIITNYDFYRIDLDNFELLDYLSELKRIRLEKVSIPFLSKTGVQLENLQKLSLFMCNVNEAFKNYTVQVSDMLPNLVEMNIDYCDMVELPIGISNIVSLRKLSITSCHKLSSLPEDIGKLVNLESLRLCSCTELAELPDSITSLNGLKLLDISDCKSLIKLPENMGELCNLEKLHVSGSRLGEWPQSMVGLGSLKHLVCDEETKELWEPLTTILSGPRLEVVQADFNLNWLNLHS